MPGKVLILTGAPESRRLDWADSNLLTTFQTSIAQFALLQPACSPSQSDTGTQKDHPDESLLDLAVWRSLPLQRTHIHTGFSQQHDLHFVGRFPSSADFLTTADISFKAISQSSTQEESEECSRLLAEFYKHSLAVHDDLASSQLVPPGSSTEEITGDVSVDETTSFDADDSLASREDEDDGTSFLTREGNSPVLPKTPLKPAWGVRGADHRLSDLQDIPSAKVLLSLMPQTVTVNLIVCIISIAAPRMVETRYGHTSTLVEVIVGDETKSGFSVTFWLSRKTFNGDKTENGVLAGLRRQDIVLMQNVALNVFRNKVYGGSLRRDMTKVHLLFRGRLADEEDVGGYYSRTDLARVGKIRDNQQQRQPQLEKTKRVREWVLDFVGGGSPVVSGCAGGGDHDDGDVGKRKTTGKRKRKGKEHAPPPRDWEQPPPLDSQSRLG